jgi:triosephosphate isomerase
VILCCGETLEEREAERTLDVVGGQLADSIPDGADAGSLVVAYEPIWAIGTGKVAEPPQIAEVHDAIRSALCERFGDDIGKAIPLLYGGSVKAANAAEIFATSNVDGALVGGASLKADDFLPIVEALGASD